MTTPSRRRRVSRKGPEQERRSTSSNTTCCRCKDTVGKDVCTQDAHGRWWCSICVIIALSQTEIEVAAKPEPPAPPTISAELCACGHAASDHTFEHIKTNPSYTPCRAWLPNTKPRIQCSCTMWRGL